MKLTPRIVGLLLILFCVHAYHEEEEKLAYHTGPYHSIRNSIMQTIDAFKQPIVHQFFEKLLPLTVERQNINNRYEHFEAKNELIPEWVHDMAGLISGTERQTYKHVEVVTNNRKQTFGAPPKDTCDPSSLYVSYDYTIFICNGTNVTYTEYLKDMHNCTSTNTTMYVCVCPLDRIGKDCTEVRPYTCEVHLLYPEPKCIPGDKPEDAFGGLRLDGDFPCFQFPKTQKSQEFIFNMNCTFDSRLSQFEQITRDLNVSLIHNVTLIRTQNHTTWEALPKLFKYFLEETFYPELNKSFALTKPLKQPFEFQVYNFYSLGDTSASLAHPLNMTDYYTGGRNIHFTARLDLEPQHMAGNRIYTEAGFFGAPGARISYQRLFLDFMDTTEPVYYDKTNLIYVTVIPSSILVLVVVIGVAAFFYFRNKKQNEEFFHGHEKRKSE